MSTRSTITVRDTKNGNEAFSIYRHSDGYPDTEHGVLSSLREALRFAWKLPRFEAMDFAAAIVAAWKQPGGGNIYFTPGRDAHGDTEWHYEIYPAKPSNYFDTATSNEVCVDVFKADHANGWDKPPVWKKRGKTHHITAAMQIAA